MSTECRCNVACDDSTGYPSAGITLWVGPFIVWVGMNDKCGASLGEKRILARSKCNSRGGD